MTEATGPTVRYGIHAALHGMAQDMPTYPSTIDRRYPVQDELGGIRIVEDTAECVRCRECDESIIPDDQQTRLGHLFLHHGWRMNGKRYDSENNIIEEL